MECPMCYQTFPLAMLERHASSCQGASSLSDSPFSKKRRLPDVTGSDLKRCFATDPGEPNPDGCKTSRNVPLAERLRPIHIAQFRGLERYVTTGDPTWKIIDKFVTNPETEDAALVSFILWGPPGCGKTSLVNIINHTCQETKRFKFVSLSACTATLADVKAVVDQSSRDLKRASNPLASFVRTTNAASTATQTVLFIDEIHRFNKLQQHAFLPCVEAGSIILIGATTENPSYSLIRPLLSRLRVLSMTSLSDGDVQSILARAVSETNAKIDDKALSLVSRLSGGDARLAVNTLQQLTVAAGSTAVSENTVRKAFQCGGRLLASYDRTGDDHYHCASALQKSVRGSDPDAALYWTIRMLKGGEDAEYVARRLIRMASEDVGLADVNALNVACSAMAATKAVGSPECHLILAQCAVYLARAPKNDQTFDLYQAVMRVNSELDTNSRWPAVPLRLRNAVTSLDRSEGYGQGYSFDPNIRNEMTIHYLPDELVGTKYLQH